MTYIYNMHEQLNEKIRINEKTRRAFIDNGVKSILTVCECCHGAGMVLQLMLDNKEMLACDNCKGRGVCTISLEEKFFQWQHPDTGIT